MVIKWREKNPLITLLLLRVCKCEQTGNTECKMNYCTKLRIFQRSLNNAILWPFMSTNGNHFHHWSRSLNMQFFIYFLLCTWTTSDIGKQPSSFYGKQFLPWTFISVLGSCSQLPVGWVKVCMFPDHWRKPSFSASDTTVGFSVLEQCLQQPTCIQSQVED